MGISSEFKPIGMNSKDVYSHLKEARANEPVFFSEIYNFWVVTRYDDLVNVLMDEKHFTAEGSLDSLNKNYGEKANAIIKKGIDWRIVHHLQNTEGADHKRLRDLLKTIIPPSRVRKMEPIIRQITNQLIDRMLEQNSCEFVSSFAYPLPILTIFEIIGFNESEEDLAQLQLWSGNTFKMFLNPMQEDEEAICAKDAVDFQRYFQKKIDQRRREPRDDLMTELILAADAGESNFSDEELILLFILGLIGAGYSTTLAQITNMIYQLLNDPERWQYVINNPDKIDEIVEESIRFDPAILGWFRVALHDISFGGKDIAKGDLVFISFGSANRDENKFEDSESFCPVRPNRKRPMTFSQGRHACPGSALARLELQIALEELAKRIPSMRLVPDQSIQYAPSLPARAITSLQVEWDKP
ncbi:cytochrome P450 [Dasania marina]|uniref:cytochrome P450 n=1 Tax=Dasania marina TaxID=471499 RepID=UPI00037EFD7C|nr:cytochrome P450 [Dasania marina]